MKIKKLALHSNNLANQVSFFKDVLGFAVTESKNTVSFSIGASTLEFVNAPIDGIYHYCFLIPCNQIENAKSWLSQRVDLIPIKQNNYIAHFESWNAHSIYFYDGNGNIAELIARHDLQNESDDKFSIHSFLSINEIGTPTSDPRSLDLYLKNNIGSLHWKGDLDRFSTNGDQNGLFLLPNYTIKKTWFPTELEVKPLPYIASIIQDKKEYLLTYENEILSVHFEK